MLLGLTSVAVMLAFPRPTMDWAVLVSLCVCVCVRACVCVCFWVVVSGSSLPFDDQAHLININCLAQHHDSTHL